MFEVREEPLAVGLRIALFTFSNKAQILNKDTYSDSKKPKKFTITIKPTNFKMIFFFFNFSRVHFRYLAAWSCVYVYRNIRSRKNQDSIDFGLLSQCLLADGL